VANKEVTTLSADYVPSPAETTEAASPGVAGQVQAYYANWSLVTSADESHPVPTLVLGNDTLELHLELGPERLDELLSDFTAHVQNDGGSDSADLDPDSRERRSLGRRIGGKAVRASGWSTADRWWRATDSSTRIIVAGFIAAVMVLGLLVTF
jgi:hypothetical protein